MLKTYPKISLKRRNGRVDLFDTLDAFDVFD